VTGETKRITLLGVIDKTGDPNEVFVVDVNASPEEIAAAILRANAERAAAQLAESKRLRALFLPDERGEEKPQ
jgi:hypothetical protein